MAWLYLYIIIMKCLYLFYIHIKELASYYNHEKLYAQNFKDSEKPMFVTSFFCFCVLFQTLLWKMCVCEKYEYLKQVYMT